MMNFMYLKREIHVKQKLIEQQGQIDKTILAVKDHNTALSICRIGGRRISKVIKQLKTDSN